MPGENFDHIKLLPILQEAYQLVEQIEAQEKTVIKEIRKLEAKKEELMERKKNQASMQLSIEDMAANSKQLFKTIMCPLVENCPNDTRQRWPKSSDPCVTQFGSKCPYAHHPMELTFPQTLQTKIHAIGKIQENLAGQKESKRP